MCTGKCWRIRMLHKCPELHLNNVHYPLSFRSTEIDTGEAVRSSSVPREDLFVVTKLWHESHGRDKALAAFNESLTKYVQLDFLND